MKVVFDNPYRVLGLTNPVTNKELTKRISDLNTFIEFGKPINYPLDFSKSQPLNRSLTSTNDAARKIESDSEKLFQSLFWFYQYDTVDEMAIDCLKKGDVKTAYGIWSQQIKKSNEPKFSWLINLNVLNIFRLSSREFNSDIFENIVENYGLILSEKFEKLEYSLFTNNSLNLDEESIGKKVVDTFLNYISTQNEADYSVRNLDLLYHFDSYPENLQEYLQAKLLNPCIHEIQLAIESSRQAREEEDTSKIYDKNGLGDVEYLVTELDYHSDNYKVQNVINEYAEEAKYCSLFAYNVLDDSELAQSLIEWADTLPADGSISDDISEKRAELEEICRNREQVESFQPILALIEEPINSVWEAEKRVLQYKNALDAVRNNGVASNDELYVAISSRCVHNIINFTIDVNNDSFEVFEKNRNLNALLEKQFACKKLLESVMYFTQDNEARQRMQDSLAHINKQISDIQQATQGQNTQLVKKEESPEVVGGVIYNIGNATGLSVGFLRLIYVIGTLATGFWPGVILYIILVFLKGVFQSNNNR